MNLLLADDFGIEVFMPRPTLLVAEREPLQALSTRKLVLETGKLTS